MTRTRRSPQPLACALLAAVLVACGGRAAPASAPVDSLRALMRTERWAEAAGIARARLAAPEAPSRTDSLARAEHLDVLAEALWRGRLRWPDAESLATEAVRWRARLHGEASREVAANLGHLGCVQRALGRAAAARVTLERSLELRARVFGPTSAEVAEAAVSLGNLLRDAGELTAARASLERALAVQVALHGPDHPGVARVRVNLAVLERALGRFQDAVQEERMALAVFERATPLDTNALLVTLTNHQGALMVQSRSADALPVAERALELARRRFAPGHPGLVQPVEAYATVLCAVGRHDSALAAFRTIRSAIEGDPAVPREQRIRYWTHLAGCEQTAGHTDSVIAHQRRAVSLADADASASASPSLRAEAGGAWLALAERLDDFGRTGEARDAMLRARAFLEPATPAGHPDRGAAAHNLAQLHFLLGHPDSAVTEALAAMRARAEHVRWQFAAMSEDEAVAYRERGSRGINVLLSALLDGAAAGRRAEAWQACARATGVVLDEMTSRRRLLAASGDSVLVAAARELADVRGAQAVLWLGATADSARLRSLRAREVALEQDLATRGRRFARARAAPDFDPGAAAAALPPGSALVQFVRFDRWSRTRVLAARDAAQRAGRSVSTATTRALEPWYAAFVLRAGSATPALVDVAPADSLERDVRRWAEALAADAPLPRAAGMRLRRALWDRLAPALGPVRRVCIVPDGELTALAWATLPGARGEPLLVTGPTLHVLTHAREVLATPAVAAGPLLALGHPDFDRLPAVAAAEPARWRGAVACDGPWRAGYSGLPGTAAEVARIAALWRGARGAATVHTGTSASEAALRREAPGARVVHVASHGFHLADTCVAADVPLMLRAGIVLAGINRRDAPAADDGLLTAADLALLDLDGAELVTLSTCRSGAGRALPGEGVAGLRRALAQAGASASLTALHAVEDDAAAFWMGRFHEAWLRDGQPVPEAARAASLALRALERQLGRPDRPSQWGAFVTAGAVRW